MYARQSPHEDVIAKNAMASERRAIGEHGVIADLTIMRHVAVGHEESAVADLQSAPMTVRVSVPR